MRKKEIKIKKTVNIFSNQKGMALLTTLIFTFVIGTLAVAVLSMTSNDTKLSALQRDSTKAFYLAESGIQNSIKELKDDFEWSEGFNDKPLGDGTYTVIVKRNEDDPSIPPDQVRVTSTGIVGKPKRIIEIFVKKGGVSPIFKYAIASKTDLRLTGSTLVDSSPVEHSGNIYASGNINLVGSATIDGSANAVGTITQTGSSEITGDSNINVDEEIFPIINTAPYISEAQAGGTYEGDYKITGSGAEPLGPLYINGDLKVTGSTDITLGGTVYVTGKVNFTGSGSVKGLGTIICVNDMKITGSRNLTPENMPVFISTTGDIKITGSTDMQLVVYAPEGEVKHTGSGTIYGSIVCDEYNGTGSSSITYNTNLANLDLNLPPGPFSVVSWQEVY